MDEEVKENQESEPGTQAPAGGDQDTGFPAPEDQTPSPTRLEWKVTPVIYRRIQESADHMDR